MTSILLGLLTWRQRARLDEAAPTHFNRAERIAHPDRLLRRGRRPPSPFGCRRLFGLAETPRIAGGRVPLVIHLSFPGASPRPGDARPRELLALDLLRRSQGSARPLSQASLAGRPDGGPHRPTARSDEPDAGGRPEYSGHRAPIAMGMRSYPTSTAVMQRPWPCRNVSAFEHIVELLRDHRLFNNEADDVVQQSARARRSDRRQARAPGARRRRPRCAAPIPPRARTNSTAHGREHPGNDSR